MKIKYKNILLLEVLHCTHPEAQEKDQGLERQATFRPVSPLGLAVLSAYINIYTHNPDNPKYNVKAG